MIGALRRLGHHGLGFLMALGESGLFLLNTVVRKPRLRALLPLVVTEIAQVGVFSLVVIFVSGLFIGLVVGLQGYHTLDKFGATSELGQMVALSVTRELGPVVTALLFAGRAGTTLAAEIGLMKTTEQLASMEMMGVDPLWRVIAPRFWAGLLGLPLLTVIFMVVAIYGGYVIGVLDLGIDPGLFWNNMQQGVDFYNDIVSSIIKSAVFAVVVTWIALYQGYASEPTAAGIGQATTKTVVYASLAILGLDFILTAIMIGGW